MGASLAFRDLVADIDLVIHDLAAWDFTSATKLPDGATAPIIADRKATAELIETVSSPATPLENALNIQWGVADFTAILWVRRSDNFSPGGSFPDYFLMGSQRGSSLNAAEIDWHIGGANGNTSVTMNVGNRGQAVTIALDTWTMLAFTVNSSAGTGVATAKFYSQGVLISTSGVVTAHIRTAGASNYFFSIGNDRNFLARTLTGASLTSVQIAHATLFARELSAAEIAVLYAVL